MKTFMMELAGYSLAVSPLFETTAIYCRKYWTEREPEYTVTVRWEELAGEQMLLDWEADDEGLKRRKFSEPFLERSLIQRKIGELLIERNVLLMHGSTVAVDGQAYLFTADCGTGKSTHTRLWREVFGERAVMVNDDKPFLKVGPDGVTAYGSPWSGKHGLDANIAVPLKGICVLERGTANEIRYVSADEVIGMLQHQAFLPQDERGEEKALALVRQLAERVPLWKMRCNREHDAAVTAYEAMKLL